MMGKMDSDNGGRVGIGPTHSYDIPLKGGRLERNSCCMLSVDVEMYAVIFNRCSLSFMLISVGWVGQYVRGF